MVVEVVPWPELLEEPFIEELQSPQSSFAAATTVSDAAVLTAESRGEQNTFEIDQNSPVQKEAASCEEDVDISEATVEMSDCKNVDTKEDSSLDKSDNHNTQTAIYAMNEMSESAQSDNGHEGSKMVTPTVGESGGDPNNELSDDKHDLKEYTETASAVVSDTKKQFESTPLPPPPPATSMVAITSVSAEQPPSPPLSSSLEKNHVENSEHAHNADSSLAYLSPQTSKLILAIDEHISNTPSPTKVVAADDDFLMDMNKEEVEVGVPIAVSDVSVSIVGDVTDDNNRDDNRLTHKDEIQEKNNNESSHQECGTLFSPSLEKLAAMYKSGESKKLPEFKRGEECIVCCETLLHPVSAYDLVHKDVPNAEARSVQCPAGHQFCLNCWRSSLQMQVTEGAALCLQCPGRYIHT